jgi:acyl dehydratase
MKTISYAELESIAGTELGVSDWLLIDQARVNAFADATGDHQWIHVDVERATRELGGPIAHGFLSLSLLPLLSAQVFKVTGTSHGINYGSDRVRFTNMVKVGKRVRLSQKCLAVEPKTGGKLVKTLSTLEIEGEERPAFIVEGLSLLFP